MLSKTSKFINIGIVLFICIITLGSCDMILSMKTPTTLNDIAYDVNKKHGYTVYIFESGDYVPYLVLTNNYNGNGNCLLLRNYLLEECVAFGNADTGYYPDSRVDVFLNDNFLPRIDFGVRESIVESEITVTSKSSLYIGGEDTEQIHRKVFLLSRKEIDSADDLTSTIEGIALKYFRDSDSQRLIAYQNGEPCAWWLRTSDTSMYNGAYGVGPKGTVGGGGVFYENGVRPAFCLSRDTTIQEDEIDGEKVYILAVE